LFPYWLLFAIFAVGALQSRSQPLAYDRSAPVLATAGLFTALMIGLRYDVGGDWASYQEIFDSIAYFDFPATIAYDDPGYAILNWLAAKAGLQIWTVNLVCGAIFAWGLIRFAKRQPNPWLAVLVSVPYLIVVIAMGYTRQAVAIGIIFAGLANLDRQTLGRFVIYILFAVSFHKSAIIVLPLVALAAARQRFATAGLLFLSVIILYYLFVDAAVDRMVTNYVEHEMASEGAGVRVTMNLLPAIIYLLYQKKFKQVFGLSDMQAKIWRNFAAVSVALLGVLLVSAASTAVDRIALYFIPLQLFVWSRVPLRFPSNCFRSSTSQ
jgi:hypothetical protein